MKLKLIVWSLFFSASLPALAGTVDYHANDGGKYTSIIIKYAQKYPQARSGDKVIGAEVADREGNILTPKKLFPLKAQTRSGDNAGDPQGLNRYYQIALPADKQTDAKYINQVLESLAILPQVELVYPEIPPVSIQQEQNKNKSAVQRKSLADNEANPLDTTPDLTDTQGYLGDPAIPWSGYVMGGINWLNVKHYPGAQGENITIISDEVHHWNTNHVDLPPSIQDFGTNITVDSHDTRSVGIMVAKDNGFGITGIANKARIGYAASTASALTSAGEILKSGDVVQIGLQYTGKFCEGTRCIEGYVPMETQSVWFDAIKSLTDRGIIVVEAAANGSFNLDDPAFEGKYDPAIRDSGAILVGAFCAKSGKTAAFSNYSKRVTSASWGCDDVVTTTANGEGVSYDGGPNNQYTNSFNGTSSANPIIAGAAASLSGYAQAKNILLTPRQVRSILGETGTKPKDGIDTPIAVVLPGVPGPLATIGTQPDLVKAFQAVDRLQQ